MKKYGQVKKYIYPKTPGRFNLTLLFAGGHLLVTFLKGHQYLTGLGMPPPQRTPVESEDWLIKVYRN